MVLGDLAHEGQAEAPAAADSLRPRGTVERLEDALALLGRNAGAAIA